MNRTTILSLCLVSLVLLAGCSNTPSQSDTTQTVTTTNLRTDTTTTTPTPVGPTAITTNTTEAHANALKDAGSFNATSTVHMKTNDSSARINEITLNTTYAVDFTANRFHSTRDGFFGITTKYTTGNTTYKQQKRSPETAAKDARYQTATAPYSDQELDPVNTTEAIGADLLPVKNLTFTRTGTTTYDGTKVAVFNATGQQAIDEFTTTLSSQNQDAINVTNVHATIKIDGNGIIRYQRMRLTYIKDGSETSMTITHTISDIGSATVPQPSWLDHATTTTTT